MTALIVCHSVLAACARPLVRTLGRRAFVVLALPPAAATVWAATQRNTAASGSAVTWSWRWMPAYDVTVALRFDALAELMVARTAYRTGQIDHGELLFDELDEQLTEEN
ncbi:hypothetical protein OG978_31200 [Streptomyces sp. NBC_01591]|uniref:hypothetical protein n=1 Tax=Streptomyces sp. NBC_01591 TaxID=2975888 RepID=UPI002DD97131|nr:hypothetical protein [Streptomyces sp. NBC_01591]WSD71463.1 hypothetical protein OG978_31200 [Streptomyces sp. NBC_01591]